MEYEILRESGQYCNIKIRGLVDICDKDGNVDAEACIQSIVDLDRELRRRLKEKPMVTDALLDEIKGELERTGFSGLDVQKVYDGTRVEELTEDQGYNLLERLGKK